MKTETLTTLRNRKPITLFNKETKLFTRIQFNKKEQKFVCWERWVKKAGGNWVNWNLYLSLKDINNILESHKR